MEWNSRLRSARRGPETRTNCRCFSQVNLSHLRLLPEEALPMMVLHVGASDLRGGASRAAYRIHRSICEHGNTFQVESRMRVIEKLSEDQTVEGGKSTLTNPLMKALQPRLTVRHHYGIKFETSNTVHHSFGWPDTGLGEELNHHPSNIVHLHWVGHLLGNNTLSVNEIGNIRQPVVWTLHDQWAFCGAEHYTLMPPAIDERYIKGYRNDNRPHGESGQDRNRLVWEQKVRCWKRPFSIVCPSAWMAKCAKESLLMHDWPIQVIPYPVDVNKWAPIDQRLARRLLGLPDNKKLILLCADGDSRKGGDLLLKAMQQLKQRDTAIEQSTELVLLGQVQKTSFNCAIPVRFAGRVSSDVELHLHYAAADVIVIPSRQDNLPLTGIESHACGTPAVGFRVGGLPDIITHHTTGAVAEPFDPESLASEIAWVLEDEHRRLQLGAAARAKAEQLWAPNVIAAEYCKLYTKIVADQSHLERKQPSGYLKS
jgi:glycosyltransferase involved in cell wall biosynthesis